MWYKKRWLTEPDAEAMLEAKDKKIEELTEKLLSDDRQISAYDIEVNELRDKLQSDDRQIALYDDELRQARKQAKRLLKMAMEDLAAAEDCGLCKYEADDIATCQSKPVNCFVWRHADEALALIGGESDD